MSFYFPRYRKHCAQKGNATLFACGAHKPFPFAEGALIPQQTDARKIFPMRITKLSSSGPGRCGFTLVEITFALGVISIAFVGLLGLLPLGMQTFRSAMDTAVRTQISQRVVADAMQTGFSSLISNPPEDRYFDEQGSEVKQSPSLYHVRVQVLSSTALPSQTTSAANPDLATVQVKIAPNPRCLADPYSDSKTPVFETTAFVARNKYP